MSEAIINAFRDKLFLLICIFETLSCIFKVVFGVDAVIVIRFLLVAFLWLIYAKAMKSSAFLTGMYFVNGTVTATYIISFGLYALIILVGGVLLITSVFYGYALFSVNPDLTQLDGANREAFEFLGELGIYAVVLEVIAVAGIVINFICIGKIGSFANSLCSGIRKGGTAVVEKAKRAEPWFWVYGCFSIIVYINILVLEWHFDNPGVLEYICLIAAFGLSAACYIIGGIFVKKHFITVSQVQEKAPENL